MEKTSFNSFPPSTQLPLFVFHFFVQLFFQWVMMCQRLLSSSRSFLQSKAELFLLPKSEEVSQVPRLDTHKKIMSRDDEIISRDDVETVMERLGFFLNPEEESFDHEVSEMFEQKEPTVDEVEAAFCIFDENRDGFIDARELQRVLSLLGLKEGSELADCKKMIASCDQNGDGRIDFSEFVDFMQLNL